jgi:hypothetical protein
MCKEMPVTPVNRVVVKKRILGKNGGPRRRIRRGCPPPHTHTINNKIGLGSHLPTYVL